MKKSMKISTVILKDDFLYKFYFLSKKNGWDTWKIKLFFLFIFISYINVCIC